METIQAPPRLLLISISGFVNKGPSSTTSTASTATATTT
ncbi:hypothetical protein RIB2604_02102160 [Aspergillus luchuensis]|uniref:Uncharacterized protein n=1 Tax=Aspergillus kawachii TaxID=1069201 RepID=A0A146FLI1_ASPKA|nr:hypothetical protein RIB2604_02102160 [Aspergillus luchuensis]